MRDYYDTLGAFVVVLLIAALVAWLIYHGFVFRGPLGNN